MTQSSDPAVASEVRIGGLEALIKAQAEGRRPALDSWDPPYCGDIGMAIAADGTWSYRGSPIGRPALVKLFASILRREDDGRCYLVTPVEKVDVAVADAPFVAVEMEVQGHGLDQVVVFRTNVDDIVRCGPGHPLRFAFEAGGLGLKPYLTVRPGLEALLTRTLAYDLVELAIAAGGERAGVRSDGSTFLLPPAM